MAVELGRSVRRAGSSQKRRKMKTIKTLVVTCCTFALLAGFALRADDDKKPCCPATVEGGKTCEHECCKKASADGKVCKKCHKEEKKDETK